MPTLEQLITTPSPQTVKIKQDNASPSTSPDRFTVQDALGALAMLLSSQLEAEKRLSVVSALTRFAPDHLTADHVRELREALNRRLFMRAMSLPSRPRVERIDKISVCAITEHSEALVCPVCNGIGKVHRLRADGTGVHPVTCERCAGNGRGSWSDRERGRVIGAKNAMASNSVSALYYDALSILDGWMRFGFHLANCPT